MNACTSHDHEHSQTNMNHRLCSVCNGYDDAVQGRQQVSPKYYVQVTVISLPCGADLERPKEKMRMMTDNLERLEKLEQAERERQEILNNYRLDEIDNPRLQRLRHKIMGYNFIVQWIKGTLTTSLADTLIVCLTINCLPHISAFSRLVLAKQP